jgi:penicillin G amidase
MHGRIVACLVGFAIAACGPEDPTPALRIETAATLPVTRPAAFTAVRTNVVGEVTWAVTGGGTLSATTGNTIVYAPPPGTATATLTASVGSVTASLVVGSGPATLTSKTIPGLTAPVTVLYDAQDIPHIKCAATVDCLAVQGYVQARDRFFQMDFLRHVSRAKLAELIGTLGLSQDVQLRTLFVTRSGNRLEDDLLAALDPATKRLLDAYVAGINAYLDGLRKNQEGALPGEYAQLPFPITPADVADWSIQDTLAIARLQQFQLSETLEEEAANGQFAQFFGPRDPGKITAWIRAAAPTSEQAHTLPRAALPVTTLPAAGARPRFNLTPWKDALRATTEKARAMKQGMRAMGEPVGSNNWVVAATKSANRMAMVANDPHLTLQYPPLFYLSVLTSSNQADNLDLAGGAFPGIPGALVGRGAHVAWGVTVVGYDVTDLYLEQLAPQATCPGGNAGPPCVVFKGGLVSTIAVPQIYKARTAAGVVDVTSTLPAGNRVVLVVPHHGPIIEPPDAAGKSVSARWTGHEGNTQDVKAIFGLNTAANVDAAITALKGFSTGAQNFVLADDQGHIAYDPHALVPIRKWTETALAAAAPPWFPVPGDGRFEWGDGTSNCAAATLTPVPATCWIADELLPQGKDPAKGYFMTANSDPIGVSDDNNPLAPATDLPYLSFQWSDSTGFRASRIDERLSALTAKPGGVTLADMEALQADHVSRPGKAFGPIIAALPTAGAPPELALAQSILTQWGNGGYDCPTGLTGTDPKTSAADTTVKVVQDSSGCYLFHAFLRTLVTNVFGDDLAFAKQGLNGGNAIKAILYMLDPGSQPGDRAFCFDVNPTTGVQIAARTCGDQVAIALVQAYQTLTATLGASKNWVWGRVHTIQPVSLLALVTTNFQPGPYARPGGAFTVDVGNPSSSTGDFSFRASGNVRHISVMDPAKPVVRMQLPGPQRDGPTYIAGPDLLGQWVRNRYFDFAFGGQIDAVALTTQSFKAP